MNAYKTYITITDPKQVVLSDLPFQAAHKVEVIILAEDNQRVSLAAKLKKLFKEMQETHV
ncbi:hypothetical protein H1Q63_26590 [Desmonostoc muscorum CCALA 125]|nr:hypothetical protein [Desmonostoc muscorum CCALA 125]